MKITPEELSAIIQLAFIPTLEWAAEQAEENQLGSPSTPSDVATELGIALTPRANARDLYTTPVIEVSDAQFGKAYLAEALRKAKRDGKQEIETLLERVLLRNYPNTYKETGLI